MRFSKRRSGVSEIVASVLTVAITIIAGAGVFGFVNSDAGVSEQAYGGAVQGNIGYLQEQFVVAQVNYGSSPSTSVTVYIYNDGQINGQYTQIELYNASRSLDVTFTATKVTDLNHPTCSLTATTQLESPSLLGTSSTSFAVSTGSISSIALTLPSGGSCNVGTLTTKHTYYVKVLGQYGNSVTYFQGM